MCLTLHLVFTESIWFIIWKDFFQAINESTKGTLNPTDSIKETEHGNKHTPAINPFNRCLSVARVPMINLSSTACNLFTVWWQSLSGTHVNTQVEQFDNLLHPRHCTLHLSSVKLFIVQAAAFLLPTSLVAHPTHTLCHPLTSFTKCPWCNDEEILPPCVRICKIWRNWLVKHGTAEYCGLSWPCPVSTVWSWSIQRSQLAPAELYNEQLHSDTPESEHWALWSSWMCTICTASVYKFCSSTTTTQTLGRRKRHPSIRQWEKSHQFKSTLFYKLVIFQIKCYWFILFKSY